MSHISRQAVALALLTFSGTGVLAQSPLPPYVPGHHAPVRLIPSKSGFTPPVRFGRSFNSVPRSGRIDFTGPLVPRVAAAAPVHAEVTSLSTAIDPWTATGPAALLSGGGAFGAYNAAEGYDGGIGQNTSGRIAGIAADPTNAGTYYIASAGGGLWKTTDFGQTYIPLTDFLGDTAMGSVTIAPSNHNVIYAGTGEPNFAGDSRYGIGLLKSTDGGSTWSIIPGPTTTSSPQGVFYRKAISRIVVNPTNPNTVYLSTVVGALNGNGYADGGVWKTTDGGVTWTNTTQNKVDNNALFTDLAMNAKNPNILYTAVGYYGGFIDNGIYKTVDGGVTWTELAGGLPQSANGDPVGGQISLALSPSASGLADTLYVSIPSSGTAPTYSDFLNLLGLYKSTDSGVTFTKLAAPDYVSGQSFYDNALAVSPTNPNVFFAAGKVNYDVVGGFYNGPTIFTDLRTLVGTTDGGQTFHDYSLGQGFVGPHTDTHALTFTADGKLLDGNDGGIWRLENPLVANPTPPASDTDASGDNINWTDINGNLNTIQFTGIALDPSNAGIAYGGAQDNGTSKLAGGVWNQVVGGDGGFSRVDASNPQTVYQEFYGISLSRSDDGGQNFYSKINGINTDDPSPNFNQTAAFGTSLEPAAFYVPYKLDPLNTSHVVYVTDHVYLSTNKGDLFTPIGIPGMNGYLPGGATGAYVDAVGIAGQTIYVEIGAHVYATFNNGASWSDRSIPATLNGGDPLSDIHVNPSDPLDVYATKPAFDDYSVGKVFRSTNGGQTWTDISGNLPNIPFNSVRLDRKSGTLYAAGDNGVYATTNFGGSWTRIPGSLPTVQVVDLDISRPTGLLGAGTHGRGLWTTPLSQVAATPNLKVNTQISRISAAVVQMTVTVSNSGTASTPTGVGAIDVANTSLSLSLGGQVATPIAVGAVPAYGQSQSFTVFFTNVPAGTALLRYSGTYTGSSFTGSQRVSVP